MTDWRETVLTPSEVSAAYAVAGALAADSLQRKLQDRLFGKTRPAPASGPNGALGEQAISKIINRHWPMKVGSLDGAPDIGEKSQVRARSGRNGEDLCLRPTDNLCHWFYLVVCRHYPDTWASPGGIWGKEALHVGQRVDVRLFVRAEFLSWGGPDE